MEPASKFFSAMEFIAHSHCARSVTYDVAWCCAASSVVSVLFVQCRGTKWKIKHFSITLVSPPTITRSENVPLGMSLVFHQWNIGINTHVMMFEVPYRKSLSCFSYWSHVGKNLRYFDSRNHLATLVSTGIRESLVGCG